MLFFLFSNWKMYEKKMICSTEKKHDKLKTSIKAVFLINFYIIAIIIKKQQYPLVILRQKDAHHTLEWFSTHGAIGLRRCTFSTRNHMAAWEKCRIIFAGTANFA